MIILHNPLIKINNQPQSVYLTLYHIYNIHNATNSPELYNTYFAGLSHVKYTMLPFDYNAVLQ